MTVNGDVCVVVVFTLMVFDFCIGKKGTGFRE